MSTYRSGHFALLAALTAIVAAGAAQADDRADFVRLMNLGKAHLENRSATDAIETLTEATVLNPGSAAAFRNLARGHLLVLRPDAAETALAPLAQAAAIESDSAATRYLTGLVYVRMSRFAEAIPHLEQAARLDASIPAVRYQLANALQAAGRHDAASAEFEATIRLDPLHATAHYRLANYARRSQDKAAFDRRMREFTRLRRLFGDETRTPTALETCRYTRPEGPAPRADTPTDALAHPAPPVRFTDVTAVATQGLADLRVAGTAVIDVGDDGRCALFIIDTDGRSAILTLGLDGVLTRAEVALALPAVTAFDACIAGNFHDVVPADVKYDAAVHAQNDVLLLGGEESRLLRRRGRAVFDDVTAASGLEDLSGRRARWLDYDHDGDLDLVVAGESGIALWQNNGNATFSDVTADIGLMSDTPATDAAAADLDANNAIDLVVARGDQPTLVFQNQRAGRYAPMPEPPGPWPPTRQVLLDDLDSDGSPDVALVSARGFTIVSTGSAARRRIELTGFDVTAAALVDFDNDGRQDLCLGGRGRDAPKGAIRMWRNSGGGDWVDVSQTIGLDALRTPALRDVIAADLDGDGDADLTLITETGEIKVARNDGGHVNGQLKLLFRTIKTNPSAIGAHVEVRAGDLWVTRSVSGLPVEIGLNGRTRIDSVQTVWTNGVVETLVDLAAPPGPLTIVEKNVATGSCPFLYAWDGRSYRFVTDLLGNSPVGLSLARDVMLPADPDELVFIGDADDFVPDGDGYRIVITDEFRELLYLDTVRLVAVDHPSDVEMHPTDKLMPPPFPRSEVLPVRANHTLLAASGDDGIDRTGAARAIDGVLTRAGLPLPPPLRGMCRPLALTLDFGTIDATRPLILALTGWLQYGDASANIAMSQNRDLVIIPPTLEVETADGVWARVDVIVGMPAGKTKTILCDLTGLLPRGARRLRLTTTFEIRWDRIALTERVADDDMLRHVLPPRKADLQWRGFSELVARAPNHPSTPAYEVVTEWPPWRTTPQGWCTRYGDVLELVAADDAVLAILNAGDALAIEFDATMLPSLADGMIRSFFLYSVGWDKDEDYNVVDGDRVEPLPVEPRNDGGGDAWRLRYNTRWVPHARFAR